MASITSDRVSIMLRGLLVSGVAVLLARPACSSYYGVSGSGGSFSDSAAGGRDAATPLVTGGSSSVEAGADGGTGGSSNRGGAAGTGGGSEPSCLPDNDAYMLGLCARLTNRGEKAQQISESVIGQIQCNVKNAVVKPSEYLNALTTWTLDLWGCGEGTGVKGFALVDAGWEGGFSRADADTLIKLYVGWSVLILELSPTERDEMQLSLGCLAERRITNSSETEHELAACETGTGGVTGSGGVANTGGVTNNADAGGF